VVQVVDAVQANQKATVDLVATFCALSKLQAESALNLAVDLTLLTHKGTEYEPSNPFVRFIATPDEIRKAALLRILLESYQQFIVFRERLLATNLADTAALQTRTILDLDAHREEIKDTLISLGTYSSALVGQGGGRYRAAPSDLANPLLAVAAAAHDEASAERIIRDEIGSRAETLDRQEVIIPLASALLKANTGNAPGAVGDAARAVESFLARLANRLGVSLVGTSGINQKLDKFRPGNHLPKKTVEAAKYLGQVRNAADHGVDVDPEVGAVWHIQRTTSVQYVFVACSFIASALERETGGQFLI
jgi:hypothetical protein